MPSNPDTDPGNSNPAASPAEDPTEDPRFVPSERTEPAIRYPADHTNPHYVPKEGTEPSFQPSETTAPIRQHAKTDPEARIPVEKTDTTVTYPDTDPGLAPEPTSPNVVAVDTYPAMDATQPMPLMTPPTAAEDDDEDEDEDDRTEIVQNPQMLRRPSQERPRRRNTGDVEVVVSGRRRASDGAAVPVAKEETTESTMIVARTSSGEALPKNNTRIWVALGAVIVIAAGAAVVAQKTSLFQSLKSSSVPVATIEELPLDQTIPLLQRAQEAARDRSWAEVAQLANTVLLLQPDNPVAMDLALLANDKMQADEALDAARKAMTRNDWRLAYRMIQGVPDDQRSDGLAGVVRETRQGLITQLGHEANEALRAGNIEQSEVVIEEMKRFGLEKERVADLRRAIDKKQNELDAAAAAEESREQPKGTSRKSSRRNYRKERENKAKLAHAAYAEAIAAIGARKDAPAKEALEKVLKFNPKHALAHRAMGIVLIRMGKKEQAAVHYRRYIDLKPNAPEAAAIRKMLSKFEK